MGHKDSLEIQQQLLYHERKPEIPWDVGAEEGLARDIQATDPIAIPALASLPRPPTAQASPVPGFVPESPRPLFLINKAPIPRLPPNRHLGPLGLGIKACFAKEALCLEKHPSPAAQPFKEPALFCLEKAPPDLKADAGGPLISGQAPHPSRGEGGYRGQARRGLPSWHCAPFLSSAHLSPHPLPPS